MAFSLKKITSLFFLLLGLAPLLYILVGSIKKMEIWERMKEKMGRQPLETVILPEDQVVWMDKHEIWVNEQMFDIFSKKLENGVYTFTGLYDEEETVVVLKGRKAQQQNNENNVLLTRLFQSVLTVFHNGAPVICYLNLPSKHISTLVADRTVSQFREILTPPPQTMS